MKLCLPFVLPAVALGASVKSCHDCLKSGTPESVGLLSEPLKQLETNISAYNHAANYGAATYDVVHPIEPGSSVIVGHKGTIVSRFATGYANLYANVDGELLPESERIKTQVDTIYDMASLTKMYTTIAALREIEAGKLDIEKPVVDYIPYFATNDKQNVTIRQLMTHTSGFDSDPSPLLFTPYYENDTQRKYAVLMQKLLNAPGSTYLYSDINFQTLAFVLEEITGKKLDELIGDFTSKLGMKDTFFNRGNKQLPPKTYSRMATTEFQIAVLGPGEPQRPQPVRGTVHDEQAWATDGVSGHAGLFSTVDDTAILCQMILNNGTYNGQQILKPETVDLIFHNYNTNFPGDDHGLGFELNQYYWSGPMANEECAGHTGFTGTTMAIDRASNTFFLLFAHRVHPSREWSSNNLVREAVGYWVAKSLGRDVAFP
ncbi:hypothetical protein TRVA0_002S02366 [Trichomonascus vanleenenianus]|uniref:serine hydrolase domain-containing protein n=1 Tax=Trichomonascus vanleenenianus TaxID=2268995 RepID=UPI003ECA6892